MIKSPFYFKLYDSFPNWSTLYSGIKLQVPKNEYVIVSIFNTNVECMAILLYQELREHKISFYAADSS